MYIQKKNQLYIFPVQGLRFSQDTGIRFPDYKEF